MMYILNMSLDISGDKLEADRALPSTRFDAWEKIQGYIEYHFKHIQSTLLILT